jgi:hypothetical protein
MKTVTITYDWWEAVVEVDDTQDTIDVMTEQLLFWSGGKSRIKQANGDVITAYMKMLGEQLITLSMTYSLNGIISHFDEAEGWYDVKGNHGVKLISCNEWEFEDMGVTVS